MSLITTKPIYNLKRVPVFFVSLFPSVNLNNVKKSSNFFVNASLRDFWLPFFHLFNKIVHKAKSSATVNPFSQKRQELCLDSEKNIIINLRRCIWAVLWCVNDTSWICTFFLVCCFSSVLWYYHLKSFCQYCVVLFLGGGFVNVNDWLWIATNSCCLFSFTDEFIQDRVTGGNELARKIFFAGHSFVVEN